MRLVFALILAVVACAAALPVYQSAEAEDAFNAEDAYVLDKLGIDKEDLKAKVKEVLNAIKEHGKNAGIKLIQDLLKSAHGIVRDTLERLLGQLEGVEAETYIIDKIVDVDKLKAILQELLEHGKSIGKSTLEQLLKISKGAAKQMLEKILEQMKGQSTEAAYVIDKIVDVDQVKQILTDLLEHGKKIGKATLEQLIKIAKGAARDMLIKILEQMERKQEEAYFLDKIGIDEDKQQQIRDIISKLKETKDAGINVLKDALKKAKGAYKLLLEKLLEKLSNGEEAYGLDKFGVDKEDLKAKVMEVLNAIKEHGKNAGIKVIQDLLKSAHGMVKATLEKLLAQLEE